MLFEKCDGSCGSEPLVLPVITNAHVPPRTVAEIGFDEPGKVAGGNLADTIETPPCVVAE